MSERLTPERIDRPDWACTRALIASDFARLLSAMDDTGSPLKRLFWTLLPNFQALFWYRLSRWLHVRGWRNIAWLIYLVNSYMTRVEIPPTTRIGAACLIGHATGCVFCGRVGDRFTAWGDAGFGGGLGSEDVGGGPGLPWVGDDVTFGFRAMALGPIRIGDGARIGPGAMVTRDVPAGALVAGPRSRVSAAAAAGVSDVRDDAPEDAP